MKKQTKKRQAEVDRIWKKILSNKKIQNKLVNAMVTASMEFGLNWKHQIEWRKRKSDKKKSLKN